MINSIFLLTLSALCTLSPIASFKDITMSFSSSKLKTALEIVVNFTTTWQLEAGEAIVIELPQLARTSIFGDLTMGSALDMPFGEVLISPSTQFIAEWVEGTFVNSMQRSNFSVDDALTPFYNSKLRFVMKKDLQSKSSLQGSSTVYTVIPSNTFISLKIYASNSIGAWCAFPSRSAYRFSSAFQQGIMQPVPFRISTNATSAKYQIEDYPGIGDDCVGKNKCNGHGACNYCFQNCICLPGYGSPDDLVAVGGAMANDCSERTCPAGRAIADLPTRLNSDNHTAHALAECSSRGICDHTTGLCSCFAPFTGSACERMTCPNDCSGHGRCLSMQELSALPTNPHFATVVNSTNATDPFQPLGLERPNPTHAGIVYGTATEMSKSAWDYNVIYGCECDSRWPVGFGFEQWQLPEYFGADCSLKRCPSGDDPFTYEYEEDCYLKNQQFNITHSSKDVINVADGGVKVGEIGNFCLVECSNRGRCDHSTGVCHCFDGSWGDNCGQRSQGGSGNANYDLRRTPSRANVTFA